MESTFITMLFRTIAILIGVIAGYFSYKIYQSTKGATKGWFYLSVFGVSLFFWSSTTVLFKVLIDNFYLRTIFGSTFLLLMAYFINLGFTKLAVDFNVDMPRWFSVKFVLISLTSAFFLFLLGNMFLINSFDLFLRKLLSISHFTLVISIALTLIPTYSLMRTTKKAPWIISFFFILIATVGFIFGQYFDSCCGIGGDLSDKEICSEYDLDYMEVIKTPCINSFVGIGKIYQLFLLVGIILCDISFYLFYKNVH